MLGNRRTLTFVFLIQVLGNWKWCFPSHKRSLYHMTKCFQTRLGGLKEVKAVRTVSPGGSCSVKNVTALIEMGLILCWELSISVGMRCNVMESINWEVRQVIHKEIHMEITIRYLCMYVYKCIYLWMDWSAVISVHWMFVSPPKIHKFYMLKPNPQWDGLWRRNLRGVIRSWGQSPHEWGQCPCEKDPGELPCPSTRWGLGEKMAIYELRCEPSPDTKFAVPWSWTFQPPKPWETDFCCL